MARGLLELFFAEGDVDRPAAESVKLFDVAVSVRTRKAIVRALVEKAMAGDVRATAFLYDRIYGRPGAAAKPSPTDGLAKAVIAISRFNEEEMVTFARLLKKCIVADHSPGSDAGGAVGRGRLALPKGSDGVRDGSAEAGVVAQAGGGCGGTTEA